MPKAAGDTQGSTFMKVGSMVRHRVTGEIFLVAASNGTVTNALIGCLTDNGIGWFLKTWLEAV
jgi:hypothetical protein